MLKLFRSGIFHSKVRNNGSLGHHCLTQLCLRPTASHDPIKNQKLPVGHRRPKINGGCRRGKSMKLTRLISSTHRIWTKNSPQFVIKTFPGRVSSRLICSAMDQNNSTANGVVEKTASQLKKEAQRQAKMEKFAKKKEKEAALMENQNQVILGGLNCKGVVSLAESFWLL